MITSPQPRSLMAEYSPAIVSSNARVGGGCKVRSAAKNSSTRARSVNGYQTANTPLGNRRRAAASARTSCAYSSAAS